GRKVLRVLLVGIETEQFADEAVRFDAVEFRLLAALQDVELAVEFALQAVHHARFEAAIAILVQHVIEPVLRLDQEVEAPLAIVYVESEEKPGPLRKLFRPAVFTQHRVVSASVVNDAAARRPSLDDLVCGARSR